MDRESFDSNFRYEKEYWWFLGRRRIVGTLINKFYQGSRSHLALDAGCGTGIVLEDLSQYARPVGIDISPIALGYTRQRDNNKALIAGDICALPFKDGSFGLITLLGVLYNKGVSSDDAAILECYRVLKKDGIIIIDEAAYKFLQSSHNISVGGVRRYTKNELVGKMRRAGFKILRASYWNVLMLPFFLLLVIGEKMFMGKLSLSKLSTINPVANKVLTWYLYAEARILSFTSLPFGPSVIIVGKK